MVVDPIRRIVRCAEHLEVVTGVIAERGPHHRGERRPARGPIRGRADAAKIRGHQAAAGRCEPVPCVAGEIGQAVRDPGRQPVDDPVGEGEAGAQEHQAPIFDQSSPRRAASSAARAWARSASVCGHTGRNMYHCPGSSAMTAAERVGNRLRRAVQLGRLGGGALDQRQPGGMEAVVARCAAR